MSEKDTKPNEVLTGNIKNYGVNVCPECGHPLMKRGGCKICDYCGYEACEI
jgi:uncharacterized Zn finger protein (UPF0148 family)